MPCDVRLYDRLFDVENPDAAASADGKTFTDFINPESLVVVENAIAEPSLAEVDSQARFQFEREGYFILDPLESERRGHNVFNRTVTLKDSWDKISKK